MLRELPPTGPWDMKLRPGGQIEVEFITQVLMLSHLAAFPGLSSPTTRIALARLRAARLLAPDDAKLLMRADRVWRTVQGILRVTEGKAPANRLSEASARALLRATKAAGAWAEDAQVDERSSANVDLAALRATLDALADRVREIFVRQVGEVGT
jgi:glutamate-ammonia-ligase adenylyltransferase